MAVEGKIINHVHGGQTRKCHEGADGVWRYMQGQVGRGVWIECDLPHPAAELRGFDFGTGMPTMGKQAREMLSGLTVPQVPTTPEGKRIANMVPQVMGRFFKNNTKYARAQSGHDLGAKGVIPDINRKTSVMIDRIWYESEVVGEPTIEVIDDLIGHLYLIRDKLIQEGEG